MIVLFASFVRAVSGFGLALIAAPLLTFVMETKSAVALTVIIAGISNIFVLLRTWRYVDLRRAALTCLGAAFGIPFGTYLLSILSSTTILLAMASIAIPLAILLMLGFSYRFARDSLGCALTGFLSGTLAVTTSMGGPPVVLFLLNQNLVTKKLVGTCSLIFLFMYLATFIAHTSLDLISTEVLVQAVILVPALWLGTYSGIKMLPKIKPVLFKRIAAGVVMASAIAVILNIATSI